MTLRWAAVSESHVNFFDDERRCRSWCDKQQLEYIACLVDDEPYRRALDEAAEKQSALISSA